MPRKKRTWLKAECWATKATLEVAQSAFLESGAVGMEVDDGLLPEGLKKYNHDGILLKAYFDPAAGLENIVQNQLRQFLNECGLQVPQVLFSEQPEEDWQGNFVKTCTTFKVDPDIYIVPSFEIDEFKKQPQGSLFIEMDPENAFGTGQHQTTQLCLTSIYDVFASRSCGSRGLDVGCGSGILAILMKKLGALTTVATETDEDALVTAQKNAHKNNVAIDFLLVDESHVYEPDSYDLVVANILAPVLTDMAHNLASCIKTEGYLILSGILLAQAKAVIKSYQLYGLTMIKQSIKDDWCALIFQRSVQ
jgi:ribosomal protein L11 methyltransferase